jgi:hypothetical protein
MVTRYKRNIHTFVLTDHLNCTHLVAANPMAVSSLLGNWRKVTPDAHIPILIEVATVILLDLKKQDEINLKHTTEGGTAL